MDKKEKIRQGIEDSKEEPGVQESGKPSTPPAEDPPQEPRATGARQGGDIVPDLWRRSLVELGANFADVRDAVDDIRARVQKELSHRVAAHRLRREAHTKSPPEQAPQAKKIKISPIRERVKNSNALAAERKADKLEPANLPATRPAKGNAVACRFRNVLVVGGMDFLGAALVGQLNAMGFQDITVTDILSEGNLRILPALKFQEFLSPGEFAEIAAASSRTFSGYSHIFYLGGWKAESMSLTKSLLAHAIKSNTRFLALSSSSSLGPRQSCAIKERHDPENFRPLTPGGLVSCLFDRYALTRAPDKNYISLKHYQLFGAGERRDGGLGGLISSSLSQLHSGGPVRLPAALSSTAHEGRRKFDFIPVEEAARIAIYLAVNELAAGVYELGSGASVTPEDMVRELIAACGGKGRIVWDAEAGYEPPDPQPEQAYLGRLVEVGWKPVPPNLGDALRHYLNRSDAGRTPDEPPAQADEPPSTSNPAATPPDEQPTNSATGLSQGQ